MLDPVGDSASLRGLSNDHQLPSQRRSIKAVMTTAAAFEYVDYRLDTSASSATFTYRIGDEDFTESIRIPEGDLDRPGVDQAALIYFLLAGVSYLKTHAPLEVLLGQTPTSQAERDFLRTFLIEGLGEFALKNGLDLSALTVNGPNSSMEPAAAEVDLGSVLIPFGGGLDSIVTVSELAPQADRASLFVAERPGARFAAIEAAAEVTGLPVIRAERSIDAKVLQSTARGYLNGHVPVTGVLSALAVLTAVATGHGAVAMSNERSASSATTEGPSGPVNHQWSKGLAFEQGFRSLVAGRLRGLEYFSWLRDRSELSIAAVFGTLTEYHPVFRSCNRAFHQDPARRLDHWCGVCDKCLFIDLALAPHLSADELRLIFGGIEPLENPALIDQLEVLVGTAPGTRPFECVGDEAECREALLLASRRADRSSNIEIARIAASLASFEAEVDSQPSPSFIPDRYAPSTRLG